VIKPDSTKSLTVSFKPTQNKTYKDSILFYHNDPNFVFSKTLLNGAGVYTLPFIQLSDMQLNYGNKRVRSSGYKTFTVTNKGSKSWLTRCDYLPEFFFGTVCLRKHDPQLSASFDSVHSGYVQSYADTLYISSNASNGRLWRFPFRGRGLRSIRTRI
jgi:hypothetical protein